MREQRIAYILIMPALVVLVLLIAYPFFLSLYMGMTDKRIGTPGTFIGLQNYLRLLQSDLFWQVFENTLIFTVFSVVLKTILGFSLALMLEKVTKGRKVLRSVILLPWVVPITLSVLIWWWMFDPSFSVLNWLLTAVGADKVPWLSNALWARVSVITVNIWRGTPFFAIVILAGLVSIPRDFYEAAEIDGANSFAKLFHITIPLLKPVLGIVVLYSTVMTVSDFVIVHVLTRGGPLQKTHLFGTLAYQIGLAGSEIGMGAAISLFIFPVLAVSAYLLLRIIYKGEEHYS